MHDDMLLPFSLPSVGRKKITAAFDGGTISSDGEVFLLTVADKRIGLIDRPASLIPDHRDPLRIGTGWPTSCAAVSSPLPAATRI